MSARLHPKATIILAGILDGDPATDDTGFPGDKVACILVPAHFAADLRLLEDIHGLPQLGRFETDLAQGLGKHRQPAKPGEFRHEVMQGMADLVDRVLLRPVQCPVFRQCIFLEETMHRFCRVDEVLIAIFVPVFGTENTVMFTWIKIGNDIVRGSANGRQICSCNSLLDDNEAIFLEFCSHSFRQRNSPAKERVKKSLPIVQSPTMKTDQFNRLQKRLRRKTGQAISDYHMIDAGDRIMVCLSGGKDSYTMLELLRGLQRVSPVKFDLVAVNLDQKQPGFPAHILPDYLHSLGVEYRIVEEDTYSIVLDKLQPGKTMCSLCSRLRRGILYRTANELGANKIALGHHMDDLVETLFLNMFFGSRLKTMPPKLVSDDRRNIVIRPLVYCREKDIGRYSKYRQYPIIPCNLCGSQTNLQRVHIKKMLAGWEKESPNRVVSIFKSMQRVTRSHMLDTDLHDFAAINIDAADKLTDLDIAFDPPTDLLFEQTFENRPD